MNMRAFLEDNMELVDVGQSPTIQIANFLKAIRHMSPGVDPAVVFAAYYTLTNVVLMKMVNVFLQHARATIRDADASDTEGSLIEIYCPVCNSGSILSSLPPPELESACFNNIACLFKQIVLACGPTLPLACQVDILSQFDALSSSTSDEQLRHKEEELVAFIEEVSEYSNSLKMLLGKRKRLISMDKSDLVE